MGKFFIKGVELDEFYDLDENLDILRSRLRDKLTFEAVYKRVLQRLEESSRSRRKSGWFFRLSLRILLLPFYFFHFLGSKFGVNSIHDAEQELRSYYELPRTKVRRFRLECNYERDLYESEIVQIEKEIAVQKEHLTRQTLGENTKNEIKKLINDFEESLLIKQRKRDFYTKCEQRLLNIETQVEMQASISKSKKRLMELQERDEEEIRKEKIAEEFEVFDFYGNLLDELSQNLKKVGSDTKGELDELELGDMLKQVEKIKLTR